MTVGRHADDARENVLWDHTAPPGPETSRLEGEAEAKVAVIGAGIAGLSTALHLATAGISVVVLEAGDIGGGATGRSGGLIAPDFIRHTPDQVEGEAGPDRGEALVRMIGGSAAYCFDLISEYGLECEAAQNGFWTPAHNERVAESLRTRVRQWQARGFGARYADQEETARTLGTDRYCGALVLADGGTLNPLAFARGLARVAIEKGVAIFENNPVHSLERQGGTWRLNTADGPVTARQLVLAANGGNGQLHPGMRGVVMPLDVIEYATRTLDTNRYPMLENGASFTDKQPYVFTGRFDAERRLIAAFPDFAIPRSRRVLEYEARTRVRQHFPHCSDVEIEFLWPGRAWLNSDLLPRVYDLGDSALAIQACNGRGLSVNTVLGAELARAIANEDYAGLPVAPNRPQPIRGFAIARHVPTLLMLYAHLRSKITRAFTR
ncbi:NAD(P)/FAD-dependent oxidoreductase [Elongatibacter sediminis]|uniref:FAD-binding oxidoreductase n=1 Tax=Elongatibacter sediminis TaxID=3119006 RepID=A0AAW9RER9_9GAMM